MLKTIVFLVEISLILFSPMRKLTNRKLLYLISVLQKFERVRRVIYEYEKVFRRGVETPIRLFVQNSPAFRFLKFIFDRSPSNDIPLRAEPIDFSRTNQKNFNKGAIIEAVPVIEEAGCFYDSNYNTKPGCEYKNPFILATRKLIKRLRAKTFRRGLVIFTKRFLRDGTTLSWNARNIKINFYRMRTLSRLWIFPFGLSPASQVNRNSDSSAFL